MSLKHCYRLSALFRTSFSVHFINKTTRRAVTESKVDLLNGIGEMSETRLKQFYRRELPKQCIAFSSQEGKKLFSESLGQGYMGCYFKLAEQFRTQDEPAFCGLTTLVMVLNSLSVDPGRVWKGPWRWYHENMLDCCVPLQMIKQEGINFNQMICLACCNGLDVQTHQMSDDDNNDEALEKFRTLVIEMTQKEDQVLVLSYSRKVLGQTGDGHFSPVGGYHPERDLVLILDTARFKYPPHWVSLRLIWEAMLAHDKSTGRPRGYMVMSRLDVPNTLVLFKIFPVFSVSLSRHTSGGFSTFISLWRHWLSQSTETQDTSQEVTSQKTGNGAVVKKAKVCCSNGCRADVTAETKLPASKDIELLQGEVLTEIRRCIVYILQIAENISAGECILTTNVDLKCVQDQSKEHACVLQVLLSELESLPLYNTISEILAKLYSESPVAQQALNKLGFVSDGLCSTTIKLCKANSQEEACNLAKRLTHSHFLAIFLLSWPYVKGDNSILNAVAQEVVLKQSNTVLQAECSTLRKQISLLMKLCQDDGHCAE